MSAPLTCQQCRKGGRTLGLADDGRMVCGSCRARLQRARDALAAAVNRGRALAVDLAWCHESDRHALGRRLARIAARTPGGTGAILAGLAASLRSKDQTVTADLTSVSLADARSVSAVLDDTLEREILASGPCKDVLVAVVAGWHEWTRRHQ